MPSTRQSPARVQLSTIVQGAVNAGLIQDTAASRSSFAAWARNNASAAVMAAVGYSRGGASRAAAQGRAPRAAAATQTDDYPAAWRPTSRQPLITTTTVEPFTPEYQNPNGATEYPAAWLAPSQTKASGVRVGAARAAGTTPARRYSPSGVRVRLVHTAGATAALSARQRDAAPAATHAAQAGQPGHYDRHDLIAAAGGNAARLAAMRTAETNRYARERAAH